MNLLVFRLSPVRFVRLVNRRRGFRILEKGGLPDPGKRSRILVLRLSALSLHPVQKEFFVPTRFAGVVNLICFSDGWLSHVCF